MQKPSEFRQKQGSAVPMTVFLILGLLFFGAYLLTQRFAPAGAIGGGFALILIGAYLFFSLLAYLFFLLKEYKQRSEEEMFESLNTKMHNMFKYSVDLPYAILDEQGKVRVLNSALQRQLAEETPFYRGTVADFCGGVTLQEIVRSGLADDTRAEIGRITKEALQGAADDAVPPAETMGALKTEGTPVRFPDGSRYMARAYVMNLNDRVSYLVTFTDASELLSLKEKMERDMPAVAYIDVDNLEELTQYTHANYREASRKVDDVLIKWVADMDGYLREYERDRYMVLFSQEKLNLCEQDKFSALLDRVRDIRLGEYGIPVTVSVGVSLADCSMAERAAEASSALDMALQRGGDQVAVRRREGIRYYGGQTRPFQRRTKVQSRVVANYLLTKISAADNLLVMGHKNPDFDSIGSCIGVAQLGLLAGIPTKIIVDLDNPNFRVATERLRSVRPYNDMFISGHKGLDLVRSGTLLVIADANNFGIIESSEVANSVRQVSGKIAIIDHHRQSGEYEFEPVVNYIDPSASSASELVAEMLEQSETGNESENTKLLTDEVASVMLSGIMLDTNGFTRNTGGRTLDAARYLYGKGANAEYVHSFFNQDYEDYMRERSFFGCDLMQNNTVGLTWSRGTGRPADDRVAAAKEADRLLGVKGVAASFALVLIDNVVHISGRSDGSVNVQLILEKMGGGGRYDSAGAAVADATLEGAVENLKNAVRQYFAETDEAHRGA